MTSAGDKIGVLTIHHALNIGAVWQASSMARLFGAVIVDCRHPKRDSFYRKRGAFEYNNRLQEYIDQFLPLSKDGISSTDEDEWFAYIESLGLATLVVGSDEVWKISCRSKRRAKRGTSTFQNGYFPDERVTCKRVSFAASAGKCTGKGLSSLRAEEVARRLAGFDSISVRDRRTGSFVEFLLANAASNMSGGVRYTPDPTWATPSIGAIDPECARRFCDWRKTIAAPKIALLYDEVPRRIDRLKACNPEWHFVTTREIGVATPPELEASIKVVDLLITKRMHGIIAACRNATPFVVWRTRPKILELLQDIGLSNVQLRLTPGYFDELVQCWPYETIRTFGEKAGEAVVTEVNRILHS